MNTVRWQLINELHCLADRLASGEVPEKGAAAELGRKIEAALNERRPQRKPANRAKQARLLGDLLSQRAGVQIRLSYSPYKDYDGKVAGWKVQWSDGPAGLKEQVSALSARVPALDIARLRYERGATDRGRIAALIRHLDAQPHEGPAYAATNRLDDLADRAWDTADYPERMDDETAQLVTAVFSLDGHDYTNRRRYWSLHSRSLDRLAGKLRQDGWSGAREWLLHAAYGLESPALVSLSDFRGIPRGGQA